VTQHEHLALSLGQRGEGPLVSAAHGHHQLYVVPPLTIHRISTVSKYNTAFVCLVRIGWEHLRTETGTLLLRPEPPALSGARQAVANCHFLAYNPNGRQSVRFVARYYGDQR
jgi:hypothetical protein